jgi:uncharacterized integral membrane protein (TIGR00698 family)
MGSQLPLEDAHPMYLSLAAMEGLPPEPKVRVTRLRTFKSIYPGLLAALVIMIAAKWLAGHYSAPPMLYALLIGMGFHFIYADGAGKPGVEFASRTLLRFGVALLGARITLEQIVSLGPMPIIIAFVGLVTTIILGVLGARMLGLRQPFGLLSGGAVAICGASAALAIASVLPRSDENERDAVLTVVTVTALSTIAMILYPLIAHALVLDDIRAGIFFGAAIHDVAQVVGAGFTISPEAGNVATYVKLVRVALMLPAVVTIMLFANRGNPGSAYQGPKVPLFLLGFAALVGIRSTGVIPPLLVDGISDMSNLCLMTAIGALGMKTSLRDLAKVGWKPIALMGGETMWIAAIALLGIWVLL